MLLRSTTTYLSTRNPAFRTTTRGAALNQRGFKQQPRLPSVGSPPAANSLPFSFMAEGTWGGV